MPSYKFHDEVCGRTDPAPKRLVVVDTSPTRIQCRDELTGQVSYHAPESLRPWAEQLEMWRDQSEAANRNYDPFKI